MAISLVAIFFLVVALAVIAIRWRASGTEANSNQSATASQPSANLSANTASTASSIEGNTNNNGSPKREASRTDRRAQRATKPPKQEGKVKRVLKKIWPF